MKFPRFYPLLLAVLFCIGGCDPAASKSPNAGAREAAKPQSSGKAPDTVTLVIDHGDGFQKRYTLPIADAETAMAALEAAHRHVHPLSLSTTGGGETLMIGELDGAKNEGGGADKKNWLYWVDGKFGESSPAVCPLKAGDTIVWKFAPWSGDGPAPEPPK